MCTGKYSRGLILRREVMGSCGLDWCTWIQGGMRSRGMEVRARCRVASTWTAGQAGGVRHTWAGGGGGADARLRRVSRGAGGRKWQVWVTPWQGNRPQINVSAYFLFVIHWTLIAVTLPCHILWAVRNIASNRQYTYKRQLSYVSL